MRFELLLNENVKYNNFIKCSSNNVKMTLLTNYLILSLFKKEKKIIKNKIKLPRASVAMEDHGGCLHALVTPPFFQDKKTI